MFSGSARYFNTEYQAFFPNQEILFIRCVLYKDTAEKAHRQYEHFSSIEIRSTINHQVDGGFKPVSSTHREEVKSNESQHRCLSEPEHKRHANNQSRAKERLFPFNVVKISPYCPITSVTDPSNEKSFLYCLTGSTLSV